MFYARNHVTHAHGRIVPGGELQRACSSTPLLSVKPSNTPNLADFIAGVCFLLSLPDEINILLHSAHCSAARRNMCDTLAHKRCRQTEVLCQSHESGSYCLLAQHR